MLENEKFISSLTKNDKISLINLLEGLPIELNKFIKRNINQPWFEMEIFRGPRKLHMFSSIKKWMDMGNTNGMKRTETVDNPNASTYQSLYSAILYKIDNSKFPTYVKNALVGFMNAESYDDETLAKLECEIAKFISSIQDHSLRKDVCKIILTDIILYKSRVCDFYTRVSTTSFDIALDDEDANLRYYLNSCILSNMNAHKSFADGHDLAVFVYMYYRLLGIANLIEKYNLAIRFESLIDPSDSDYLGEFRDKLFEFCTDNASVTSCMERLVHPERYVTDVSQNFIANYNQPNSIDNTDNVFTVGSYTVLFKDNAKLQEKGELLSNELTKLNPDNISLFFPEATPDSISFNLQENDIGHIETSKNMLVGTVYTKFDDVMKYILMVGDDVYLLFKISTVPSTIYGINLEENNNTRKVISIKKNASVFYKYISEV